MRAFRNTNGVAAYQTEATLLAQQVEWLLIIRSRAPVDAVNTVAIATADILEVIANTPTLVQAREAGKASTAGGGKRAQQLGTALVHEDSVGRALGGGRSESGLTPLG